MNPRILLVEDDPVVGKQVVGHLGRAGYTVEWWTEGRPVDESTARSFDLVVLDLMLPGADGLDVLKELRGHADVPVLVLSARTDSTHKIRALRLGADDFVTKPFWPEELLERVRARLRRPTMQRDAVIEAGPLRIDLAAAEARLHGQPLALTATELGILSSLAARPGQAVSRQWLADRHLDPGGEGGARTLDVHISRLRKKLGEDSPIETVFGLGYRFRGGPTT